MPACTDRRSVLDWQRKLLVLGEATGILRVEELKLRDGSLYRFVDHGFVCDYLDDRPDMSPEPFVGCPDGLIVDRLEYGFRHLAVAATLINYHSGPSGIGSEWVSDLRDLGERIGLPRCESGAAVGISGGVYDFPDPPVLEVNLSISADVFFPWTCPLVRWSPDEPFDNRKLAQLNGGRLNTFLAGFRQATIDIGGTCEFENNGNPELIRVDADGMVLLDTPRPEIVQ